MWRRRVHHTTGHQGEGQTQPGWVYLRTYRDQSEASSSDFLRRLQRAAPMKKISNVLTDNGSQFTDRFTSKTKTLTGDHAFDRMCALLGIIGHHLCPPRHPQTNGLVKRFNGRIAEAKLETTLQHYLATYNHRILQRALNHQYPIQALQA
jgi:transposase InsO family protein